MFLEYRNMSCALLSLYFLYLRCLVSLSYSAFCEWNRHFWVETEVFPKDLRT